MQDSDYDIETIELKEGDCLLLYTDGLIDTVNFDGELWGKERLVQTAKKLTACTANQMIKNILAQRRRFSGLASQTDDTSIIVIKVDANANKDS
jgi:serine phosphatase RsbU (regulator of sigma subunit)